MVRDIIKMNEIEVFPNDDDDTIAYVLGANEPIDWDLSMLAPESNEKEKVVRELVNQLEGKVGTDENGPFIENDNGKFYIDLKLTNTKEAVQADYVSPPKQTYYSWRLDFTRPGSNSFYKSIKSNSFYFDINEAAAELGKQSIELAKDKKNKSIYARITQFNPDKSWISYNYQWNNDKFLRMGVHEKSNVFKEEPKEPPKPMDPKTKQLLISIAVMLIALVGLVFVSDAIPGRKTNPNTPSINQK